MITETEMLEFIKVKENELASYEIWFINSVKYKLDINHELSTQDKLRLVRLYRDLSE